jgi:hypothetical protein
MHNFRLAWTTAPILEQTNSQVVKDTAIVGLPLSTILKITILVVAIFVSARIGHDAGWSVKVVQLFANKDVDVIVRVVCSLPTLDFLPTPRQVMPLFLLHGWLKPLNFVFFFVSIGRMLGSLVALANLLLRLKIVRTFVVGHGSLHVKPMDRNPHKTLC